MPKLRSLSGKEVVRILESFDFVVIRIKGSHHIMRRTVEGHKQTVNVPVHGNKSLSTGLLRRLYRDLQRYVPEEQLKSHFYTD